MKRLLRLLIVPAVLITFALTSLSCGDDDDDGNPMNPGGGTANVTITIPSGASQAGNGAFSPNPANMTVGQTVRWVNNDNMLHTATHTSEFNVSIPAGSQSQPRTMANAGTFNYQCTVAGHVMTGQIVVTP